VGVLEWPCFPSACTQVAGLAVGLLVAGALVGAGVFALVAASNKNKYARTK
jgi:hypothetical protein